MDSYCCHGIRSRECLCIRFWFEYLNINVLWWVFYGIVLRQRQRYGLIDKSTIILNVNDPQEKLGSGGATLNALLVATEFLSAKAGYSVSIRKFIVFKDI